MKTNQRSLFSCLATLVLSVAAMLLLGGCIEFEEQTMVYHHDTENNELRILQVYHGIFGGDGEEGLTDQELDQFQSVFDRDRTFFFANWIFEYDEKGLREAALLPKQKEGETPTADEVVAREAFQKFANLAIESTTVENGGFYMDDQNRLCGWQTVRIKEFSTVLQAANDAWNAVMSSDKIQAEFLGVNEDEKESPQRLRFKNAADAGHRWIGADGNRLWVRVPGTPEGFLSSKQDHAQRLRRALADNNGTLAEEDVRPVLTMLENPLWVSFANGIMEMRCGFLDMNPVRVHAKCFDGYSENAIGFAKTHGGIGDKPDFDALTESFVLNNLNP